MLPLSCSLDIVIPRSWPKNIKSRVVHVISLAHYAITYARCWYARYWAANSKNARVRLQAKLNTAIEEIAKLCEELRIKDSCGYRSLFTPRRGYLGLEKATIIPSNTSFPRTKHCQDWQKSEIYNL